MQSPNIATDNEIKVSLRNAAQDITRGIEQEINNLHQLSPIHRVIEISAFTSVYLIGALAVYLSKDLNIIAMTTIAGLGILCMGVAMNALPILIHEGLHGMLAYRPRLNHLLSFLCGLPLGVSATAYQVTHNNHHYELGKKPDYGTYKQHFRKPVLIWTAYMLQLFVGTFFYLALIPVFAMAGGSARSRIFIVIEYLIIITVFILMLKSFSLQTLQVYWLYPALIMSVLTNLRGLGSHALGDVENIYLSSRTIKASRLTSMILLNENLHLEHHLFPTVPSYHLPKLHALVWNRLPCALYSSSYTDFITGFFKAAINNDLNPMGAIHRRALR